METKTLSRKYFSYSEVLKNPVRPFLNSEKDTEGVFITDKAFLNNVMTDTLQIFKKFEFNRALD
jgi:hypothetical protein